jgi:SpoVK/Ycf46/Vps4 family AAA+-type ATPase
MENNQIFIPERFKKEIEIHVISNLMNNYSTNIDTQNYPLILGIHGKSGQGKSYQIEKILTNLNIEILHISGSQLESENAGEPGKLIVNTYEKASKKLSQSETGVAIIIDDFDTGVGNWGEMVQYTINTQVVNATLMHLADNPKKVNNLEIKRIPIILTGNDFTKMYEPLSRPGRMRSFLWEPTELEKIEMLLPLFKTLSREEITDLINKFNDKTISFFVDLKSYALQDKLWNMINYIGSENVLKKLKKGRLITQKQTINYSDIFDAAVKINHHSTFNNHLKK